MDAKILDYKLMLKYQIHSLHFLLRDKYIIKKQKETLL